MPTASSTLPLLHSSKPWIFNISPWRELGFAVANFGKHVTTVNTQLQSLDDQIGKLQLYVMTHIDASRVDAPSRNTMERLGKGLNLVYTILNARMKSSNELLVEPGHDDSSPEPWMCHPVPYFEGPIVKNRWMKLYNKYVITALTNIRRHSANDLALAIPEACARDIMVIFGEIKTLVAGELLRIPASEFDKADFMFTQAHYDAYKPELFDIRTESMNEPSDINYRLTAADLGPLMVGIPSTMILPMCAEYATLQDPNWTGSHGTAMPTGTQTPGTESGGPVTAIT
jgi:hypothetical protein